MIRTLSHIDVTVVDLVTTALARMEVCATREHLDNIAHYFRASLDNMNHLEHMEMEAIYLALAEFAERLSRDCEEAR